MRETFDHNFCRLVDYTMSTFHLHRLADEIDENGQNG